MVYPASLLADLALRDRGGGILLRAAVPGLLLGVAAGFIPAGASAQVDDYEIEFRAGVVGSTPLVEDEVVSPAVLAEMLGESEVGAYTAEGVRVGPAPAPFVALAGMIHLSPVLGVEAAAGWTFSELTASSGGMVREIEPLGVAHALLSLRRGITDRFYARLGVGALRYYAEDAELLSGSDDTRVLFAAGAGAAWPLGPVSVGVELLAQMHRFGTVALRRAGGLDGTVYRFGLAGRVSYGGGGS